MHGEREVNPLKSPLSHQKSFPRAVICPRSGCYLLEGEETKVAKILVGKEPVGMPSENSNIIHSAIQITGHKARLGQLQSQLYQREILCHPVSAAFKALAARHQK